ncbi:MAG: hypothetical protein ACRER0_02930 [Gammaproteobacteria bacterium]
MNRIGLLVGIFVAVVFAGFHPMRAHAATHVYVQARVGWYGAPYYRHPGFNAHIWYRGYWHRGWYGPRFGWWWVVGPSWYYYPAPVYPYPDPYVPPVMMQTGSVKPDPAPEQYWYYCAPAKKYYPYVSECPGGWQKVPVTPPGAASKS